MVHADTPVVVPRDEKATRFPSDSPWLVSVNVSAVTSDVTDTPVVMPVPIPVTNIPATTLEVFVVVIVVDWAVVLRDLVTMLPTPKLLVTVIV